MKSIKILLLIFIILPQLIICQTKEETINWLNFNIENYCDESNAGTYKISTEYVEDLGELIVFKHKIFNPLLKYDVYEEYTFLPKSISNIYLSNKHRTNETLDVFIVSNRSKILKVEDQKLVSEIVIHMKNGNNEITKRIQKGLIHLLELMGNKIEPQKDFFKD
jgi:hypothetical protein